MSSLNSAMFEEPILGMAFDQLKDIFLNHAEADIVRVIEDCAATGHDDSLVPRCIEQLVGIPVRSESTGQQCKGLERGPLSPVQQNVLEQLHSMFPDVGNRQLKTSVRHQSNTFEPLSTPTLLQRCIDDLLDGRTAPDVCFLDDDEEEEGGAKMKMKGDGKAAATTSSESFSSTCLLDDKSLPQPTVQTSKSTNNNQLPAKPTCTTCTVTGDAEVFNDPVLEPEAHLPASKSSGTAIGEVVGAAVIDIIPTGKAGEQAAVATQQTLETVATAQTIPTQPAPVATSSVREEIPSKTGTDLWKSTTSETGVVLNKVTTAQISTDLWKSTSSETGVVLSKVTTAQTSTDLGKALAAHNGIDLDKPTSRAGIYLDTPPTSQTGKPTMYPSHTVPQVQTPSTSQTITNPGKLTAAQTNTELGKPTPTQAGTGVEKVSESKVSTARQDRFSIMDFSDSDDGEIITPEIEKALFDSDDDLPTISIKNRDRNLSPMPKASSSKGAVNSPKPYLSPAKFSLKQSIFSSSDLFTASKVTASGDAHIPALQKNLSTTSAMGLISLKDDSAASGASTSVSMSTTSVRKALPTASSGAVSLGSHYDSLFTATSLPSLGKATVTTESNAQPVASTEATGSALDSVVPAKPSYAVNRLKKAINNATTTRVPSASSSTTSFASGLYKGKTNYKGTPETVSSLYGAKSKATVGTSETVSSPYGAKSKAATSTSENARSAYGERSKAATGTSETVSSPYTARSSAKAAASHSSGVLGTSRYQSVGASSASGPRALAQSSASGPSVLDAPITDYPLLGIMKPQRCSTSGPSGLDAPKTDYPLLDFMKAQRCSTSGPSGLDAPKTVNPLLGLMKAQHCSTSGPSGLDTPQTDYSLLGLMTAQGCIVNDGATSFKTPSLKDAFKDDAVFVSKQKSQSPSVPPGLVGRKGQFKEKTTTATAGYASLNPPQSQWRSPTKEKTTGKQDKPGCRVKKTDIFDGGHHWRATSGTLNKDTDDLPSIATTNPALSTSEWRVPASSLAATSTVSMSTAANSGTSIGEWRSHSRIAPVINSIPARSMTSTQVSGTGLTLQNTFPIHAPKKDGTVTIESRYKITYQGMNSPTAGPNSVARQDVNANQKPAAYKQRSRSDSPVPRARARDLIELTTDSSSNDSVQDVLIDGTVNLDHSVRFIREELPMDVDAYDDSAVLVSDDDDQQPQPGVDPTDNATQGPDRGVPATVGVGLLEKTPPRADGGLPGLPRAFLDTFEVLDAMADFDRLYPEAGPQDPRLGLPSSKKKKKRKKSLRRHKSGTPVKPIEVNAAAGTPGDQDWGQGLGGATGTALDLAGGAPLDLTVPEPPGSSKVDLKNDILSLFPDIDPAHVDTLVAAHTGPMALNDICNGLLETPYPRKKAATVPPPTATVTSAQVENVDYFKDYKSVTIPFEKWGSYNSQSYTVLSNDFSWISGKDIRYVMGIFDSYYAPSYQELGLIWKQAVEVAKKKEGPASESNRKYSGLAFVVEIEAEGIKKKLNVKLLKNRRPVAKTKNDIIPELRREIDFVKTRLAEIAKEADMEVAMQLNEQEYSAEGQSIECGCCYGEYSFESMIQCCEGHLFCQTCLKSYAKEAVYGQGKLISYGEYSFESMIQCCEGHLFCQTCPKSYAKAVYGQGKADLKCMTDECDASFPKSQLKIALPSEMLARYEDRIQEENINLADLADLVRCPHCDYAALMDPHDRVFACMKCEKATCRHCKENWEEHFGKRCEEVEKKDETKLRLAYEEKMTAAKVRTCHKCKAQFTKEDGCNKMTCRCGATMCYICREPKIHYDHFCRHARDPGKDCATCKACSLWTNPEEDDNRAVKEIQKEAEEMRKEKGFTEERLIGAPDEPPAKKAKR